MLLLLLGDEARDEADHVSGLLAYRTDPFCGQGEPVLANSVSENAESDMARSRDRDTYCACVAEMHGVRVLYASFGIHVVHDVAGCPCE